MMENLIETTAWGMLHSLWIGALLYGLLQLGLYIIGYQKAALRSALAHLTLFGMFVGFVVVFWTNFRFSESLRGVVVARPLPDILFLSVPPQQGQGITRVLESYFPYLVSGYALGLLLQFVFLAFGLLRVRKLQKNGLSAVPGDWQDLFEATLVKMRLSRKIGFHLSTRVTGPIVVGFLRPMVLIPVAIVNHLDLQQAELILLHELAHIRRHDYLLNLMKTFIETILFFNPFVWLCGRIIQAERENACDDTVLRISSQPIDYAHTLFRVAAHSARQKPSLALGAGGQHKYHLLQRIKRITNMNNNQKISKQPLLALLLAVLVAVSLAWIKPQKEEPIRPVAGLRQHTFQADTLRDTLMPQPPLPPVPPKPLDTVKAVNDMPEPVTFHWDNQSLNMDSLSVHFDSLSFKFDADTRVAWNQNADSIKAYFHSPAWKKQLQEIQKLARTQGERARKLGDSISAYYNSPEWKKQLHEIQKQTDLARVQARIQSEKARQMADSMRAKFDSPEWKNKIRQMTEVYSSSEYKKLKEKFDREVEALKERKLKNSSN